MAPDALPGAQETEDGRMPFLAHLGELRHRIVVSLVALGLGFAATFSFSEQIIRWLARPLEAQRRAIAAVPDRRVALAAELESRVEAVFPAPTYGEEQRAFLKGLLQLIREVAPPPAQRLQVIDVTEAFWVNMKVALVAGGFLVLPVILYEVWAFVAPGLLPHERRFALPFVIVSTGCFGAGAAFALSVIVPFAVTFLSEFKTPESVLVQWSLNRYVDFILKMTLAFGLVFETPLGLTLGTRMGLVTPEFLARNRKYAVLLCALAAAILTPTPDAFNMLLMAGPMYLLYEIGIQTSRMFGRRRAPAA
jgi:sec-independent protein translocase protein TatC